MSDRRALIGSIQKFSVEDGPGIRTTVFLKGCSLRCRWCHNPELISHKQEIIRIPGTCIHCGYCFSCPQKAVFINEKNEVDIDRDRCDRCMECVTGCYAGGLRLVAEAMGVTDIIDEVKKDLIFYEQTNGGMTVSGGELLTHAEFVLDLIRTAQKENIMVCLDTSGQGDPEMLRMMAEQENVTDILYDLKCIDSDRHKELTGQYNDRILSNLRMLSSVDSLRAKIRMRMPLIAGLNDDMELLEKTAELYQELKLDKVTLLPYHSLGVSKQEHIGGTQELFEAPSDEKMEQIYHLFSEKAKMQVEILGKI